MLSGILNSLIRLAGLRRLHRRVVLVLLIGAVAVGLIFWMVPRLQPEITGAVSLQQARDALARNDFPNAERLADEELSLPMFSELSDTQIAAVHKAIREGR